MHLSQFTQALTYLCNSLLSTAEAKLKKQTSHFHVLLLQGGHIENLYIKSS